MPASGPPYPDRIGKHVIRIEGDVFVGQFIGVYAVEEARQILGICDELFRRHGTVFMLGDLRSVEPPPPETRKLIAHWPVLGRYVLVAYGLSIANQAIVKLMTAARRLLGNPPLDIYVVESEAAGRALIAELRPRLRAPK